MESNPSPKISIGVECADKRFEDELKAKAEEVFRENGFDPDVWSYPRGK